MGDMTDDERTVEAFWARIGATPEDALPRLVFADWLEERAGEVACVRCSRRTNGRMTCPDCIHWKGYVPKSCRCGGKRSVVCVECNGTRRVPDGRADLAAALRATADRVPWVLSGDGGSRFLWVKEDWLSRWNKIPDHARLKENVYRGVQTRPSLQTVGYPTAEAAIRDLCRAWVKVSRPG